MRDFKVGDEVEFGVTEDGSPIWFKQTRRSKELIGHETGVVSGVFGEVFEVEWSYGPGRLWRWEWPQLSSAPGAPWDQEGYIRLLDEPTVVPAQGGNLCTCDIHVMMNLGCQCGGE